MAKRHLTPEEHFDLRQALHMATLEALMASRRWSPGQLIFQGGTSLHLAHGSPRFSEDLDFLVSQSLDLSLLDQSVRDRLGVTVSSWLPSDTSLAVKKSRDDHNPFSFVVSVGGEQVIGAVRVKVKFWKTDDQVVAQTGVLVSAVRLASGPASGMRVFVPVATRQEILIDKVFALAARPYLKSRDIFDLYWLRGNGVPAHSVRLSDMQARFATYPHETVVRWTQKAIQRLQEIPSQSDLIQADVKRWLPSSWPLSSALVQEMIQMAVTELQHGLQVAQDMPQTRERNHALPSQE
ncbi:MAG: nucleotidyl transferase AbiEii/AbiGii toxin family protein [Acidiferrobacter sp.]